MTEKSRAGRTGTGRGPWGLVTGTRIRRLVWTVALVQALTVPASAQGPIARSVTAAAAKAAQYPRTTTYSTGMRSPAMFWSGATLVATGAIVDIAAVTWAKDSDLTHEDVNTRLNRDIAPCGTDPTVTRLPVADCKPNTGLLILGSTLAVGGGLLMVIGGQTVQITQVSPHSFTARVRF